MTAPSNPLVLLAPAMAIGSRFYQPVADEFRRVGWDVVLLPRRGFETGAAPAGRHNDWSYADEIGDISTAVAQARHRAPDRPILLFGHSLGGQLIAGHELTQAPVDGVVTIGTSLPHFPYFRFGGLHIAVMGAVVVPVLTAAMGYLPRPAFGAPGARTLMREWGRMAITGRTPFAAERLISTPSLLISLEGDSLSPVRAVDVFARRFFGAASRRRLHLRAADLPAGASNDHIGWVRTPATVVNAVVSWWRDVERVG